MTVHVLPFPENRRIRRDDDTEPRTAGGECEDIDLFDCTRTEHCSSDAASDLCARDFQPGS